MYVNPKGYKVSDNIGKKAKVNPWILSKLLKGKTQLNHEPRGGVETAMVVPMGISVSLVPT